MKDWLTEYKEQAEEIRKLYPKLPIPDNWTHGLYNAICEEQILTEFITQTVDVDKTIQQICNRFKDDFEKYEIQNDVIYLTFLKSQFDNIKQVNEFMDAFGWFPAMISREKYSLDTLNEKIKSANIIIIKYECKYDTKVIPTTDYLYHLVPDILYKRVMMNGLTPKNKSKLSNHPERVYLLNPTSDDDYEDIAITLFNAYPSSTQEHIVNFCLLQIDIKKMKLFNFYNDPNFHMGNGGLWVYENIPPAYITLIKKIEVNPKRPI